MTLAIDDVCTEAQLAEEVGGTTQLTELLPAGYASAVTFREAALRDVMKALARRDPPIRETDLMDLSEITDAVIYGAAERLYRIAMTTADSLYAAKRKLYEQRFSSELMGLTPTLQDDARGAVFSWNTERG